MPGESNGVNNAVNCYKETVQFSASFVTSLFATAINFVIFVRVTLIEIANTPLDRSLRSAVLVLSVTN